MVKLKNTIMSDSLASNLISLSSLVQKGYSITFKQHSAMLSTPSGNHVRLEKDAEDMYVFPESTTNMKNEKLTARLLPDLDTLQEGRINAY